MSPSRSTFEERGQLQKSYAKRISTSGTAGIFLSLMEMVIEIRSPNTNTIDKEVFDRVNVPQFNVEEILPRDCFSYFRIAQ